MVKHIEIHISDSLSHGEWDVLRAFCDKAHRLISTKLVSDGDASIKGNVRYEKDKGMWFQASLPPEEQVAEFLMAFRFFYLQKEDTCFPKILSIVGRHTEQEEAREALKFFRKRWENSLFGNAMQLKLNGKQITTSSLLDIWFNAHYFHSDKDKVKELQVMKSLFSEDFAKYMLLDASYEASKIVLKFYQGLKDIVDDYFEKSQPAGPVDQGHSGPIGK